MTNRGFALLLIVLLAGSGVVFAQSKSDAEQLYSSGVLAFYSQRYAEAIGFFNQIEGLGTQDPRAFFFRGLSYSRAGNAAAAAADFETAARMELTVAGRSYSVPKALERIQGRERTFIEQYRRAAKRAWEAEENLRKQEEFLAQKADDMKFYQSIIRTGETAASSSQSVINAEKALPFGAQPITPFGNNRDAFRSRVTVGVSQNGIAEDNRYLDEINRAAPVQQPEENKPKAPTRLQDPSERGIFDSAGDDEEGFDVSFQQSSSISAPRSPLSGFGLSSLGGGDTPGNIDADDPFATPDDPGDGGSFMGDGSPAGIPGAGAIDTGAIINGATSVARDSGASFGKGFAGLFKKSGSRGASSSQPATPPSNQESKPDGAGGDDPFQE